MEFNAEKVMQTQTVDVMKECGEIAARVLELKSAGDLSSAQDVLMCESELLVQRTGMSYADIKETVGFFLSCAAQSTGNNDGK